MKLRSILSQHKYVAAFVLLTVFGVQAFAQMPAAKRIPIGSTPLTKREIALTKRISLDSIKAFTKALAADQMEGRGTMQPGGDKAAKWLADEFRKLGMKPLGDNGSYLQSINFKQTVMTAETKFEVGNEKFKFGSDYGFIPVPFKVNDVDIAADMVFVGYGTQAFNGTGSDLLSNIRGKVVVMIDGPPANVTKEQWEKSGSNMAIIQSFVIGGAKAIVIVGHGREGDDTETYINYFGRRRVTLADESPAFTPIPIPPLMMINKETAAKLFTEAETSFEVARKKAEDKKFVPISLNQPATIVTRFESKTGSSSNVVGYIEGSDPELKAEAVLFSAHYDAYGVENGQIFNGAADNALGTSEMLAVAEAYSKMRTKPKRSMIFLAVTGEEYGLYGSKYWANNPSWKLSKIAANLNLDGVGTEVFGPVKNMVGYGAEHSTLGTMLEDLAKSYGIKVLPDPMPEEKVFTRSDHYSFVQKGVPALMLMGGPEGTAAEIVKKIKAWEKINYHQPSDDVMDNWHWEGAKTVADMMGILGLRISDQSKAPEWLPTSKYSKIER